MEERDVLITSATKSTNNIKIERNPSITSPIEYTYLIRNWFSETELKRFERELHKIPWKMQQVEYKGELFIPNRETIGMSDTYELTQNSSTFAIMYPQVIYDIRKGIKSLIRNYLDDIPEPVMNYCWGNRYRDGNDSIDEHKDDEDWHLEGDPIISISFGTSRYFDIHDEIDRIKRLELHHGDILIMKQEFHEKYYHSIPAQEEITKMRINLTFRSLTRPPKLEE